MKQTGGKMDIQSTKIELVQLMLNIEEEQVLQQLKNVLNSHIDLEQYNKELEEANARIEKGAYYTQQEVESLAKKW